MAYFTHQNHQLHYIELGEGKLFCILPGNTASSFHSKNDLAYFGCSYHAAALDFWGTGGSDRLAHWPENWWEQAALDTAALVYHLGEQKAILFGYSGGGIVALLTAALFPDRVSAVIADSCVENIDYKTAVEGRELNPLKIFQQERRLLPTLKRILAAPIQAAFWQAGHGKDWREVVQSDSRFLQSMAASGKDPFQGLLSKVQCPVLLTASRRDQLLRDVENQVKTMQQKISRCDIFLADSGSHPFCWSQTEIFRAAVKSFLTQQGF